LKGLCIALATSFGLAGVLLAPVPAEAQKIIHIKPRPFSVAAPADGTVARKMRVRKFGRLAAAHRGVRLKRNLFGLPKTRFTGFSLPEQTLFPPYYAAPRPFARGPDMKSRLKGGKTVRQGSPLRGRIPAGKAVRQGSPLGSRIKGGRTVKGGSRWSSRINPGRTVEQGSQWKSAMPNWRFSGTVAPMRPRGIPYFRAKRRARSPWASRIY
jgi:hypothetical protein